MKDEKGNDIPWTGEGKNGGTMPFSSCCLRPSDVKSLMAIEEKATKALPVTYAGEDEAEKMVDKKGEKPVFLQVFAAFIVKRIRKFGMESIFILISPIDGKEYNIVEKPGMFTLEDVTEKVNKNFDQGIYDHFDEQHFIWSEAFINDSLSVNLQVQMAKFEHISEKGPLFWMALVETNIGTNDDAVELLVAELKEVNLASFDEQHVPSCTEKLKELYDQIAACNPKKMPEDVLSIMVAALTEGCKTERFRWQLWTWESAHSEDKVKGTVPALLRKADTEYRRLGWIPGRYGKGNISSRKETDLEARPSFVYEWQEGSENNLGLQGQTLPGRSDAEAQGAFLRTGRPAGRRR